MGCRFLETGQHSDGSARNRAVEIGRSEAIETPGFGRDGRSVEFWPSHAVNLKSFRSELAARQVDQFGEPLFDFF